MAPFFCGLCIRELVLCDCVTGGMCGNIVFCIFLQSGWMSLFCHFVPIKRFSWCEMCSLMWFVPLRMFCRYGFGREMAE